MRKVWQVCAVVRAGASGVYFLDGFYANEAAAIEAHLKLTGLIGGERVFIKHEQGAFFIKRGDDVCGASLSVAYLPLEPIGGHAYGQ